MNQLLEILKRYSFLFLLPFIITIPVPLRDRVNDMTPIQRFPISNLRGCIKYDEVHKRRSVG